MAEDNTQDTRGPLPPRRGARPFVGPAGAAGQPLPLLRVTPMPRPAPFVPAPGSRPTLGTPARPSMTPGAPAIAAESAAAVETPANATTEAPTASVEPAATGPEPRVPLPAEPAHSPHDQFAAFDTTWHETAIDGGAPLATRPSPPERTSLGSVDRPPAPSAWVAGDATPAAPTAGPAWLMDDDEVTSATRMEPADGREPVVDASPPLDRENAGTTDTANVLPGDDGSWADVTIMASADSIIAAEIEAADALELTAGDLADGALSADEWPDPLLAEYAPYVPTPALHTPAIAADAAAEPAPPRYEDVVDAPSEVAAAPNLDTENDIAETSPAALIAASASSADSDAAPETHETRIAAALDRLADQVRLGEIDVSSVAPGGPDAAVLAAVLAALLGGGRSSSR